MNTLKEIKIFSKKYYGKDKSGHGFGHIKRVVNFCNQIWKNENLNADYEILIISAYLHDVHRALQSKKGVYIAPEDCIDEVEQILQKFNIPKQKMDKILFVIKKHEIKNIKTDVPELIILQDADALEAIGKRGLRRSKRYCKTHNIPLKEPDIPLTTSKYIADVNPISSKHYVYRTMIPNALNLKTKTAKEIAKTKIKALYKFVNSK